MGFNPAQISMAGQVAGGVTSAFGAFYGAQAQKSSLKTQAAIAETNARITEMAAQSQLAAGQKEIARYTLSAGKTKSSQRAAMAANGVDLGEGNAAETLASTEIIKEIDKNQIEANSIRSAWGLRTQATSYQNEALIKRATAGNISPMMAGATSLLGSASSVAKSWYDYNNSTKNTVQPVTSTYEATRDGWY